jgi:lipid-A-disaccharide synthase
MSKTIYIIAGETSGDQLGANLIASLKSQGDFTFHGVGGDMMTGQGIESVIPMNDLSVMGIIEVVPRLPKIIRHVHKVVDNIVDKQPDIVITIDSPDFCKPVVKRTKKACPNTKFIHYVAPTVWAWRAGRAKTMAKLFDGLICLLPFEPPYFEKEGLRTQFCGHPIIDKIEIDDTPKTRQNDHVLILPGSRKGEVKRMAPIFAEVFQKMKSMNPNLKAIIPTFPHLRPIIEEEFFGMNVTFIDPKTRYGAFKNAPFALATSGTVGLELAVAECPHVIAYKMNPITWFLVKAMSKVKYAHLVNIMNDREVIPECIQDKCNANDIMHAVLNYNYPDLSDVRDTLKGSSIQTPSDQTADFILSYLQGA